MKKLKELLKSLTDEQLNDIPRLIKEERTRRNAESLQPGDRVVTLEAGFSGLAGVRCVFLGFVKAGETYAGDTYGGDYALFGHALGETARWLLTMEDLHKVKKI